MAKAAAPAIIDPLTPGVKGGEKLTLSQRFADAVTSTLGSTKFIIGQTAVLALWVGLNITNVIKPFDPPPFILLNLMLSFQAAYAAAFVMISQNRQAEKDRKTTENDYATDLRVEQQIKDLNRKIDFLLAAIPPDRLKEIMAAADAHTKDSIADAAHLPAAFIPVQPTPAPPP
jgi:uncharacterized membrane protein